MVRGEFDGQQHGLHPILDVWVAAGLPDASTVATLEKLPAVALAPPLVVEVLERLNADGAGAASGWKVPHCLFQSNQATCAMLLK